jgi:hypothetical protein
MDYRQWQLRDAATNTGDSSSDGQSEEAGSLSGSPAISLGEGGAGYGEESTAVESEDVASSFTLTPSYTPTISRSIDQSHGQGKDAPHQEEGSTSPAPIPIPPRMHHTVEVNDQEGGEGSREGATATASTPTFHSLDTTLRPHPNLQYVEPQGQDTPGLANLNQRGQAIHGEPR